MVAEQRSAEPTDGEIDDEWQAGGDPREPLWWYAERLAAARPQGGSLIQYGCGDGWLLRALEPYFDVFGYDDQGGARHRCRTNVPDAVIYEADREVPCEKFDVVLWHGRIPRHRAFALVEHLAGRAAPDGLVALIVPNPAGWARRLKGRQWRGAGRWHAEAIPSLGEWQMILGRAGLQLRQVDGDGLWDVPYLTGVPRDLQHAMFRMPLALASYLPLSRWLLPATFGESLVLVAGRKS